MQTFTRGDLVVFKEEVDISYLVSYFGNRKNATAVWNALKNETLEVLETMDSSGDVLLFVAPYIEKLFPVTDYGTSESLYLPPSVLKLADNITAKEKQIIKEIYNRNVIR